MHPLYHARSSARKYGGEATDYLPMHRWMDQTKAHIADSRHRMVLHNSFGIFLGEQLFGVSLKRESDGKEIAVRPVLEQHVIEDLGTIPSLSECFNGMPVEQWMISGKRRKEMM
jgi:hypothetical protein